MTRPTDAPSEAEISTDLVQRIRWAASYGSFVDVRKVAREAADWLDRTPVPESAAHTDHPLRHWDRTCPACLAEGRSEKERPYDVMADAVNDIADAAAEAFRAADITPGEWDGDNIVQDVKRGIVACIEILARRSAVSATTAIERAIQDIYAAVHIWDRGHGRVSYKVEGEQFKLALDRLAELVPPLSSTASKEGQ